ncbi:hypothetical protein [Micromonospora sp. NPDC049171]|uniref:TIGR03943 family putative permease subunit n=1 Tax=Micromonospora sp. NPDC049171 TaxID=3155770 RepID=UPI003411B001
MSCTANWPSSPTTARSSDAAPSPSAPSADPSAPRGSPPRSPGLGSHAPRPGADSRSATGGSITGFITPGPDGQPILARMILSCCAADGRPVKLGMAGNAPTGLANDTWIQVTGRYTDRVTRDSVNDEEIPHIDVESWRQVTAPKDPYE